MKKYKTRSKKLSWKSDFDYWHLLTNEEKTLLDAFNRAYYGGDMRPLSQLRDLSKEFKQEAYSSQYVARHDALNQLPVYIDNNQGK